MKYSTLYYRANKEKIKQSTIKRKQTKYKKCTICKKTKHKNCFLKIFSEGDIRRSYCTECRNKKRRKQYKENPEPLRKVSREVGRQLRLDVLNAYGNKCSCLGCGIEEPKFLAVDHIEHGSGYRNRFTQGHGRKLYLWLKKHNYPRDNFQLLCHNCNFAKGLYGKCPHIK